MKVKSEREVTQSCLTLSMDCSLPGSSIHGIFQARVLEWGATAFSVFHSSYTILHSHQQCMQALMYLHACKHLFPKMTPYYNHSFIDRTHPHVPGTHVEVPSRDQLWRRQWHPTPVLLPGKSHGWRSLVGCSPRGC